MEAVRITGLAAGGEGVGRLEDGRAVFIPRTAPGDLVQPVDVQLHARYARAQLGTLLESGPDRVEPACRHYTGDQCGGCQLQHLSAPAQREAKREMVQEALSRIGKLNVTVPPLLSGKEWGYRTRFTVTRDATGTVGFHRLGEPGRIFPLLTCAIASPEVNALWAAVRGVQLPPDTERITLRAGEGEAASVVLHGPEQPAGAELGPLRDGLAGTGMLPTLWWQRERGQLVPLDATPDAAPGFSQVQPALGQAIREHAIAELGSAAGATVWDLYAGAGQASLMLAEAGAQVESVEVDPAVVAAAEQHHPRPAIQRHVGRVEQLIRRLPKPTLVYTNPPRAGMAADVVGAIRSAAPVRVVYVSCDPATLARDIRAFGEGYRVRSVRSWDLFPQTAHVETVVCLVAA